MRLRLFAALIAIALLPWGAKAQQDTENKPTPQQARMYRSLTASITPQGIYRHMKALSAYPSRVAGYPGADAAARYIEQQFREIGLQPVFGDKLSETFDVTVPIDQGASLTIHGPNAKTIKLYSLWPNGVRTCQLPEEGLTLPLIYGGSGAIGELNGQTVEGSAVLYDFNCGSQWLNGPRLGAKAVLFIEPDSTLRGEAEAKFLTVPLNMPRFWVSRKDAPALIALCRSSKPPIVTLHADMSWEVRKATNIIGKIEGTDPKLKDQIIIVEAFYDSMSIVPSLAPGAEASAGISALLELARTFMQPEHRPKRTVWFMATSAHYLGLKGIRQFLEMHWNELEQNTTRQNIKEWLHAKMPSVFRWQPRKVPQIYEFIGLDLASQSKCVGVFYKGWYYDFREDLQSRYSDIARVHRENAEKVAQVLNLNIGERFADGVNPISGKSWRNFIPAKPAYDAEVIALAGGKGITFSTTDDARMTVDTPLDTLDRVNFANLAEQTRLIACLLWHTFVDPNGIGISEGTHLPIVEPAAFGRLKLQGGFARVTGRVLAFNPRKSIVPNEPIEDSIAVLHKGHKSYMGVRGDQFEMVRHSKDPKKTAYFEFTGVPPVTAYGWRARTYISAYKVARKTELVPVVTRDKLTLEAKPVIDPKTGKPKMKVAWKKGELIYAPDLGVSGGKENYPTDFEVTTGHKQTGVVVFRCHTTALYDLVDPQSLRTLPTINVLDAVSNGEPRMYGFAKTRPTEWLVSHVEDVALIFAHPGDEFTPETRVKILGSAGPGAIRMVLLNYWPPHAEAEATNPNPDKVFADLKRYAAENPDGLGYALRGEPIFYTPLRVAQDMWALNEYRISKLIKHRIMNPAIQDLHRKGGEEIRAALAALANRQWDEFDARSRAAWGYESRAYPDVLKTMNDVVRGVIFYLFLLLPFSFFFERLVIGSKFLKNQVIWTLVIFIAIFAIFRYVHPAFDISINPMIVLLAFVMLALSALVIAMIAGRFEKELKEFNQTISGVHRVDVGRLSIASAAFSLGISNMRRRKARTVLTTVTLVLLTFTVLSFTSVVPTIRFNRVRAPGEPYYSGIMLRTAEWGVLEESAYRILRDEFGKTKPVAARAWFFGTQLGEQSFITLKRGDKRFDAKAIVGLTPDEERILEPGKRTLLAGRWFLPGEMNVVIIPKQIADALNIPLEQVERAQIQFSGVNYTVIGIFDKDKFKTVTDLDREWLTPVDFIQMNRLQSQGRQQGDVEAGFREYIHMEPDACILAPYDTVLNMGGEVRSIAINFVRAEEVQKVLDNLMPRLALNLYGGQGGKVWRFSTIGASSAKGGSDIFIPIIIASLIVLNTMLGSVYERIKEIGIFSSIGLAPGHIAALFIGEAMVYAVLGAVAGYLVGQVTAKIIGVLAAHGYQGFQGLYLNFSSLSAVLTTIVVAGVVLLSTLYPARKASEVATPAIERTWRVPEPDGDVWRITMPFAVTGIQAAGLNSFLSEWFEAYEEYSIGDFVTQDVKTEDSVDYEHGKGYRISLKAWLAPFDLGVSQTVVLETVPTTMEDVYELLLTIRRESGDVSNWKRINRRFLNTLRKQFLIWRTLRAEERDRYLAKTAADSAQSS
jgi:hypothetical protein